MDDADLDAPGVFNLQMHEDDVRELSFGRVPALIQELAKTLVDWTQEDLRKNARKPVRRSRATTKGRM